MPFVLSSFPISVVARTLPGPGALFGARDELQSKGNERPYQLLMQLQK